jgi:hypothetical protein
MRGGNLPKKPEKSAWRKPGDPPLPGIDQKNLRIRKGSQDDRTYGSRSDMLDLPGTFVEPDVRKKIADYFGKMQLRESEIRLIIRHFLLR